MGSTGLVGTALCRSLREHGVAVTAYSRGHVSGDSERAHWDPEHGEIDTAPLAEADAVVNLAGESIAGARWTRARRERLQRSRVHSTRLLVRTLSHLPRRPAVLVNASAVGYYGDSGDDTVTEQSPVGEGFLSALCQEWEATALGATEFGTRVVLARFALVLARQGGALSTLLPLFRMGLGGQLGSGQQYFPWITLRDAVRALRFVMATPTIHGAVNIVAPEPTRNAEFAAALGAALGRPAVMRVPKVALRLALGEAANELLLAGACARPGVLEQTGFRFDYPRLADALQAILD